MIKTIIIEDEHAALEQLESTLQSITNEIEVIAHFSTVRETLSYFAGQPEVDLVFSDVQLRDGRSFDIFQQSVLRVPVIFITGYDEFMLNAFEYNGIDYLLKPVDADSLRKAIGKYRMLQQHFSNHYPMDNLLHYLGNHRKKRMIVRKGVENISLRLEDIALFYTENKIVYVIDRCNKKYLCDSNLSELETELDETVFFRANRQYIININFVRGFKAYEKVKLLVDLSMPELNHCIIVSQEMAPQFRDWMHNA